MFGLHFNRQQEEAKTQNKSQNVDEPNNKIYKYHSINRCCANCGFMEIWKGIHYCHYWERNVDGSDRCNHHDLF